ncbi:hypothetical protein [Streptomyces sp. CA-179760]|uniref:hypothetical protein n=1 Tax=Streptomyces sp. CA-179760 TaxID=3240054 RepID=UPI003D8BAA41
MTGAAAGTASRHLLGSAVAASVLAALTALVASGSDLVSAFDARFRAGADRAFGTPAGWLGPDGPADAVGSALLGQACSRRSAYCCTVAGPAPHCGCSSA